MQEELNYKRVFTDIAVEDNGQGNRFIRFTVYDCGVFGIPILIQAEYGDKRVEDWSYSWEFLYLTSQQTAIREVIYRLDSVSFHDPAKIQYTGKISQGWLNATEYK